MKKVFFTVVVLFLVLVLLTYISSSLYGDITGKVAVSNFIKSVNHPSEIQSSAIIFYASTGVKAECSYALSLHEAIGYKYFQTMEFTGEYEHSQMLTGLKNGDYDINVKCADGEGFIQTSVSRLKINLPSNCVVYCQYKTKCQESADDSCGNLCLRDTDGVICGDNLVCDGGECAEKQSGAAGVFEEEPGIIVKERGLLGRFIDWLKGLVS